MTHDEFNKKLLKILEDNGISDKDKLANLQEPIWELAEMKSSSDMLDAQMKALLGPEAYEDYKKHHNKVMNIFDTLGTEAAMLEIFKDFPTA